MDIEEFKLPILILHMKIYSHLMETNLSWLWRLADIWYMRQYRWRAAATIYIALCIFLFKYGSFASFLEFLATHATALTVAVILDSYDHFSTATTIAPGQLRSYRRCRFVSFDHIVKVSRAHISETTVQTNKEWHAKSRLMTPPCCVLIQENKFHWNWYQNTTIVM